LNNAIVLAAGKSSRFGSNKLNVNIAGKTLPQYAMDFCIENDINNIYVTISKSDFYFKDNKICHPIIEALDGFYGHMLDIKYRFQSDSEYGPGAAIKCWKDDVKGPFIVLFGDNYYKGKLDPLNMDKNDCIVSYLKKKAHPRNLQLAAIVDKIIIEKPHQITSGDFFCGYAAFNNSIFDNIENIRKSGRDEFEITDMINFCEKRSFRKNELIWGDITFQGDIEKLEKVIEETK